MKIAVVGCGALGSYYGAKLSRAGQEVYFLLRSDYEVVRRRGLFIRSADGDFHLLPRCAQDPEQIGVCDLVVIGLKSTANDHFPLLLPPLVGPHTAVLTLQNGLGNEEALARLFPPTQIMGGLCFVCLNRLEPGLIHHLAHGRIVLGEFSGGPKSRTHQIASVIRHAGVPCEVTEDLRQAHWEKLVWNIPFNGLGVAGVVGYEACRSGRFNQEAALGPTLPTDKLLGDQRWESLVRDLMLEVIQAAGALGLRIDAAYAEHQIERTRLMGSYRASTLIDFERGLPLERETLFDEPLRQARQAGVESPHLHHLCGILGQLTQPPGL